MDAGYLSEAFVSYQGEGLHVGRRQLFLRFAGCPLRCRYCDTPESLVRTASFAVHKAAGEERPNPVSIDDVAWAVSHLEAGDSIDGVALTGGEPLAQTDFLVTLLQSGLLRRPRLLETAGVLPAQLRRVIDFIDVVSMDMKLASNTGEASFWQEHERFLEVAGGKAYVKILVDESTLGEEVGRAASLVAAVAPRTPVFLQPITTRGGSCAIKASSLDRLFEIARSAVSDVRVVPQTHKFMDLR